MKISQREARRLRAENAKLRNEMHAIFSRAASDCPGVTIDTLTACVETWHIANTAKVLGHAVLLVPDDKLRLRMYALARPL